MFFVLSLGIDWQVLLLGRSEAAAEIADAVPDATRMQSEIIYNQQILEFALFAQQVRNEAIHSTSLGYLGNQLEISRIVFGLSKRKEVECLMFVSNCLPEQISVCSIENVVNDAINRGVEYDEEIRGVRDEVQENRIWLEESFDNVYDQGLKILQ